MQWYSQRKLGSISHGVMPARFHLYTSLPLSVFILFLPYEHPLTRFTIQLRNPVLSLPLQSPRLWDRLLSLLYIYNNPNPKSYHHPPNQGHRRTAYCLAVCAASPQTLVPVPERPVSVLKRAMRFGRMSFTEGGVLGLRMVGLYWRGGGGGGVFGLAIDSSAWSFRGS